MSEGISKIISKYKMYMSFDKNEYEMIQKIELNKLLDYIQQKENIIKEVREYINHYETIRGYYEYEEDGYDEYNYDEDLKKELLEILDKENKQ